MRNRQSPQKTRAAIFSQQVWASAERLNWTMKNFWIFLKLQNITIKHVARITSGWKWRHSLHKTPEFIGHVTGSALWLCRLFACVSPLPCGEEAWERLHESGLVVVFI